jgi:hypothetical protein
MPFLEVLRSLKLFVRVFFADIHGGFFSHVVHKFELWPCGLPGFVKIL